MKAKTWLILLCALTATSVVAQQEPPAELISALEAFQRAAYGEALISLEAGEADGSEAWRGHFLFWQARTLMAANAFNEAADRFDLFLTQFDDHPYTEEANYQRARLFYLTQEFQSSIDQFARFMDTYPQSQFFANALYWTGEGLFSLGNIDEAERFFAEVTERYPRSFRVEAARYRLDVIELSRRENELLTLLQWSHEEYLSALESFQNRERTYQEALRSYRARLASLATDDFEDEILGLNARIEELEEEVLDKDVTIFQLLAQIRQIEEGAGSDPSLSTGNSPVVPSDEVPVVTPTVDPDSTDTQLDAALNDLKAQALELQRALLEDIGEGR